MVVDEHDPKPGNPPVTHWFLQPINYTGLFLGFFSSARVRTSPDRESWLFHDYQPGFGPKTLISHFGSDLIRSISVNHRVSVSTVTCRAWFCKTSLHPIIPPLHPNTHTQTQPTTSIFFPYYDAHSSIVPNWGMFSFLIHGVPIFLFTPEWHVLNPHDDLWLWATTLW